MVNITVKTIHNILAQFIYKLTNNIIGVSETESVIVITKK